MEEMQQHSGILGLRSKAIQQVKPVQVADFIRKKRLCCHHSLSLKIEMMAFFKCLYLVLTEIFAYQWVFEKVLRFFKFKSSVYSLLTYIPFIWQVEMDRMSNMEARLQTMQDYATVSWIAIELLYPISRQFG